MRQVNDKRFKIEKFLGKGGNGQVFKVFDKIKKIHCALKELKDKENNKYYAQKVERFCDEVKIVVKWQEKIRGILPIIDYHIEKPYWYTMELATDIETHLSKFNKKDRLEEVVFAIKSLAESLINLHDKGIVHRDIKPNNIYYYNNYYCLGDFGLVDFPDKQQITKLKESVGPKDTIAPEMKRNAYSADGKKADVYSLAKTFWILLTQNNSSFDGQYVEGDKTIGIANYLSNEHIIELEELMIKCTDNTPENRPTMKGFYSMVDDWWKIRNDDIKAHESQWKHIQKRLFGESNPSRMEWEDTNEIIKTLQVISSYSDLNHMFMPDGGGLDMDNVLQAAEEGCIQIEGNGSINIAKPNTLYYENISNDPMWSYFRVDFENLELIEEKSESQSFEEVTEVLPGKYDKWIYGNYGHDKQGNPLPDGYRIVARYISGAIVIFSKASIYNEISGTYDGRHNKMNAKEFKEYISCMRQKCLNDYEDGNMQEFWDFYNKDPFNEYYLDEIRLNYKEKAERRKQIKEIVKENIEVINLQNKFNEVKQIHFDEECVLYYLGILFKNSEDFGKQVITYDLDSDGNFINTISDSWDCRKCCIKTPLEFTNFKQVKFIQNKIIQLLKDRCNEKGFEWEDVIEFKVNFKRMKKPTHLFTKDEIEQILRNGNDHVHNTLVIDFDGYVHLIANREKDLSQYAVKHESYGALNNYVGKYSSLLHLQEEYIGSLEAWKEHLEYQRRVYKDYNKNAYNEEELINRIEKLMR